MHPALIKAINEARHLVHLESYIFEDDGTGRTVAAAMASAARRGVTVRILVDGFGAREFAVRLQPELVAAGVHAMIYRPDIACFLPGRRFRRALHDAVKRGVRVVSLLLAPEASIVVCDENFARELRHSLRQVMQDGAHELPVDRWKLLPWPSRMPQVSPRAVTDQRCPADTRTAKRQQCLALDHSL